MSERPNFEDGPNPCPCPQPVIELLALAVRYAEATGHSREAMAGAEYVKTFVEQPSEVWCAYVNVRDCGDDSA